ncbi:MAG TPA: hypothetical protein VF721_20550, partial [Pyrinomonadaceae bacterium]
MSNLKFSLLETAEMEKRQEMFFSKSIAFDEGELTSVPVSATQVSTARSPVEAEFLERLKTGDAQAFDTLVVRYSADVYAFLIRLTEDAEEARDLTQET